LRGVGGAVAAGDLELRFGRPQIAFGLVVCEWHRGLPGEQQNLVGAENPVTLCDLQVFVYEAAESISASWPNCSTGWPGSVDGGRVLIK
jgi:hypothetical protein